MKMFSRFSSRLLVQAPALLVLLLVAVPSYADSKSETGKIALQACPTTEEEIIDLELLADALRGSDAVGLFEKLRLKSAIDKLIDRLLDFHVGKSRFTLAQLKEQYDVLLMRIVSHLQHKDEILHAQLCNAWEMIWQDLEDPEWFAEKFS